MNKLVDPGKHLSVGCLFFSCVLSCVVSWGGLTVKCSVLCRAVPCRGVVSCGWGWVAGCVGGRALF